jgi:hypothetical protein
MTHADAIIGIALAATAITVGLIGTEFYALGPGQRPRANTKTISRWFGRSWFIGIGGMLLFRSLQGLRGTWHWRDLWADWWLLVLIVVAWSVSSLFRLFKTLAGHESSKNEPQSLHLD